VVIWHEHQNRKVTGARVASKGVEPTN